MKVTEKKIENSQAFLTIELEPAEVEKGLAESYHRLVKKANIPGFRKGKAPRPILERHIGKESLLEDALNNLIPETYEKAIKEQAIEPFAKAQIEITQTDPPVFKATIPLPPEIKLGDYHSIKVAPEDKVEVTEANINAAMEQLRHQHATWQPVDREVAFEDLVVLNIWSNIEDRPFINQKGVQYLVRRDSSLPAPGFAEQLAGMKKDAEKEFKLQFPPDYAKAELVGKEPWFRVRVAEIKEERLPELNDDLAKEVNPDFKTLDSLRERVANALRFEAERKASVEFEDRVIDAVVGIAEVQFPPILLELEINRLINQQLQRWQIREGLDEYLKRINKTEKELREELQPMATERVTRSLVLGKVAEEEKIEVSDAEIDAEIESIVKGGAENRDELKKRLNSPQSRESISQVLLTRKTIQRLVEIAKGSVASATTTGQASKGGEND